VADEKDYADGDEDDGQVHLPMAVTRVDLGSSPTNPPEKEKSFLGFITELLPPTEKKVASVF
jgi:hypothetical protein